MLSALYHAASSACCYITVFLGDEQISQGTGFAFSSFGEVLTAAHVVTGRWPIQHGDYKDPKQRIFCKFPGVPVAEYGVFFCAIDIEVPGFKNRVQLDMALLLPKVTGGPAIPHLPALAVPPQLGERVFVAGYSEELKLPFDVAKELSPDQQGVKEFLEAMSKGYMADMTGPLIKQGHVGNLRRIVAQNTEQGVSVECDVMYIDNSMHSGASGGPVFNERGEAIGLLSQRATTQVEMGVQGKLSVPSGCTIAISLAPLLHVARMTGGAQHPSV
jgi:hypothetical protein